MSGGEGKVFELKGNQRAAVNPADNVWLSASAGTGKTQVLSARVLRLLLRRDVDPSQILCLTFTKAGAAEMANRINAVLARWVRLDSETLAKELGFLGADFGPEAQERARTLFTKVLDCPGGGLRIDTIHAFSQYLLTSFPNEAGLDPGSRPMEDRERELLARDVLAEILVEAEATDNHRLIDALEHIACAKGTDSLRGWLMHCAARQDLWHGAGSFQTPMDDRVKMMLGIPANAAEWWIEEALEPDFFPDAVMLHILPVLDEWGTKTGKQCADFIKHWVSLEIGSRFAQLDGFKKTLLTAKGEPRKMDKPSREMPELPARLEEIASALRQVEERQNLLKLATLLTHSLEIGREFALRWAEAKKREGLLDFDDLIRLAANLLKDASSADWIRFKLDRQFDHILIDEAQDTNADQWDIIEALIDDFFSGDGAAGDKLRTIFTVGDYKQAIFGFQGTSPENFEKAKRKIGAMIQAARENAHEVRSRRNIPKFQDLNLGSSYRTSKPVLEFVNDAIEVITPAQFGLPETPDPHVGAERAGLVTLWEPIRGVGSHVEESDEKDWLAAHDQRLASRIAEQVRRWVSDEEPFVLEKGGNVRNARAGDVMVLVRRRKDIAGLIVAELHKRKVPVAGVDRLRLGSPLAVKDLLAALKFAHQPHDDLSLANLLSSPLMGWSQEDLLQHLPREKGTLLWHHLQKSELPIVRETCAKLRELLSLADYETPQALLAWLLVGPWQGRSKLVARLGAEANDPIDEFLNAAFTFESTHTPSLIGFIQWFESSTEDLKRDADGAGGQVRVMTVHGSKGLQAPIVILADATGRPSPGRSLELKEHSEITDDLRKVPMPSLSSTEAVGPLKAAKELADAKELEEHWRLLYVAITRAEEALFIGGSLGKQDKKGPHEDSWYARLEPLFTVAPTLSDDLWGARREIGSRSERKPESEGVVASPAVVIPDWARTPIGPEPKPPRPLAPSSAGEDKGADPPLPSDALERAARRGTLIHRLLERLPDIQAELRDEVAQNWLERQAHDLAEDERREILENALGVLDHPGFEDLFSPQSLAEVPIAATIDGVVVTGIIDRLLVEDDRITLVDFKTARRPPASAEEIPFSTLKQIAAYVAALEMIYPDRVVRAAVLYTQTPQLMIVAPEQIATHKHDFSTKQESL